jgi:chromate transporter
LKPKEINKTAISSPYIRSAAAPYWLLAFILPFILLPIAGKLRG